MGENPDADGRTAVRTPMQWSRGRNGGFSGARPGRLVQPVVTGGYSPEHVNVEDQQADSDSLWRFMSRLIKEYRRLPEFGWGAVEFLDTDSRAIAHRCTWGDRSVLDAYGHRWFRVRPATTR